MNYHLHRQGASEGEFPLDELRRRREAGELKGDELVWREGMSHWQALDFVLYPDRGRVMPSGSVQRINVPLIVGSVIAALVVGVALYVFQVFAVCQRRGRGYIPRGNHRTRVAGE